MPPQRKRPDLEHTREALRRHDEQQEEPEEPEEPAAEPEDTDEPDD